MGYKLAKQVRSSWSHLDNGPYRLLLEIALELPDSSTRCWFGRDKYAEFLGRKPETAAERKAAYDSVKRYTAALVAAGAITTEKAGYPGQNAVYQLNLPSGMGGGEHAPYEEWGAVSEPMVGGESANGGHSASGWGAVSAPPKKEEELRGINKNSPSDCLIDFFCDELAKIGVEPKRRGMWRVSAVQLTEKRSLDEIKKVARYALNDSFWKSRILTIPKLSEHYDQLYLQQQEKPLSPWDEDPTRPNHGVVSFDPHWADKLSNPRKVS